MLLINANDFAIAWARERGTLTVTREHNARLGNDFWAINDEHGLIEVALSEEEANERAGLS